MASMTTTPLRTLWRSVPRPSAFVPLAGPSRLPQAPAQIRQFTSSTSTSTSTTFAVSSEIARLHSTRRSGHQHNQVQTPARRWQSSARDPPSSDALGASTAQRPLESEPLDPEHDTNLRLEAPAEGAKSQKLGQIEPRLSLTFTCTADACGHRSTHEFSKRAYTRGIVLVQCPQCKNRHLIADHLGWFKESTEEGTLKTVEDLLRAKGETVRTGRVNFDGDIEYDGEGAKS